MIVYISMILAVIIISSLYTYQSKIVKKSNAYELTKKYPPYYRNILFWLLLATISVPYIIRYKVGTDFSGYYLFYDYYAEYALDQILSMRDFAYYGLAWIVHRLTDGNWYVLCVVLALFAYAPIIYYYKRHAYKFTLAFLIYIMFMCYFVEYNAVRQGVAIAFTTLGSMYLVDKKYMRYVICMFVAYRFHATSIIFVPFSLLALLDYRSKLGNFIKGVLILSVFVLNGLWSVILNFFDSIGQEKIYNDYSSVDISTASGSGYLRLAVYLVPVIIMFIFGKKIFGYFENKRYDEVPNRTAHINYWVNCIQFSAIFMFASTRYWIFARVAAFFAVFVPIVISHFICILDKKARVWFYIALIVLYFIYMYLMAHTESNLLPFQTEFGWYFN